MGGLGARLRHDGPLAAALALALAVLALRRLVPFAVANDHTFFLPASWWYAATGTLANPWMSDGFDRALNWHGFLQPFAVGVVARAAGGSWNAVFGAVDLLALAAVAATAFATRALGAGGWRAAVPVLVATAVMLDARSRPEVASTLLASVLVVLVAAVPRDGRTGSVRSAALGSVGALLCLAHPLAGAVAGLAVAVALAAGVLGGRVAPGGVARLVAVAGIAFAATALALVVLVFGDLGRTWLAGMREAGRIALERADAHGHLKYLFANRFLPGFVIAVVPLALAGRALLAPRAGSAAGIVHRLLPVVVAVAAAVLFHRFVVRVPATYYNFTALLAPALAVAAATRLDDAARRLADVCLAGLAASATAGALLWSAQAVHEAGRVAPTRAALAAAIEADVAAGGRVCADAAALPAVATPRLARAIDFTIVHASAVVPPDPAACDVYYELQAGNAMDMPDVPGFSATLTTIRDGPFTRAGLRPSHFAYARMVPAGR